MPGKVKKPFSLVKRKSLSVTEAIDVFNALADMPGVSFGYTRTGCFSRAHIMCQELLRRGITPKKAWAFCPNPLQRLRSFLWNNRGVKLLHVTHPTEKNIYWRYHVAPTIPVRMPNGNVQDMVLDPSLFNTLVTLKEWGAVQRAVESQLEIRPREARPRHPSFLGRSVRGMRADSKAEEEMERWFEELSYRKQKQRTVFAGQLRRAFSNTGALRGRTWKTAPLKKPQLV